MAKVELKTKQNEKSVAKFIAAVKPKEKQRDSAELLKLMQKITGEKPRMWGSSIVGFGTFHYKGKSGREGEWFLTGFSPRKQNLTVYIIPGFADYGDLLARIGKHKTGSSCLYLNSLESVDRSALRQLITQSVARMRKRKS